MSTIGKQRKRLITAAVNNFHATLNVLGILSKTEIPYLLECLHDAKIGQCEKGEWMQQRVFDCDRITLTEFMKTIFGTNNIRTDAVKGGFKIVVIDPLPQQIEWAGKLLDGTGLKLVVTSRKPKPSILRSRYARAVSIVVDKRPSSVIVDSSISQL